MKCGILGVLLLLVAAIDGDNLVTFTVVLPKLLYYDSPTVASVSAYGVEHSQTENLTLEYRGLRNNSLVLNSTFLEFTSDGSKNWTVLFTWDRLVALNERHIQLVVQCRGKSESRNLSFAQSFGYIFVQTDKPIYRPEQTVKYRIVAVDEEQKLSKYKIRIDIKNEKQTIVSRNTLSAEDAFRTQYWELPKETSPGNWSITTSFEGVDHSQSGGYTVDFEVKEYDLPRFWTNLEVRPGVITPRTENVTVEISTKYFFDKPVVGSVEMKLGTWHATEGIKMLNDSYVDQLENGKKIFVIPRENLNLNPEDFTKGKRLYVKVNTTEATTLSNDTFEDTSTYISEVEHVIKFEGSKSYFKPKLNYTLMVQVMYVNKKPAPKVGINTVVKYIDKKQEVFKEERLPSMSDDDGRLILSIQVPETTTGITFKVIVVPQQTGEESSFNATILESPNKEYIEISLFRPFMKRGGKISPALVHLNYTKPSPNNNVIGPPDNITLLVLARGHIVYTNTVPKNSTGGSYVALPTSLYFDVIPSMTIVAYFRVKSEYVIDSIIAETNKECIEEVFFQRNGFGIDQYFKPGESYLLKVEGGPYMRVGLVAVDTAVLGPKGKHVLTRPLMFDQLDRHDQNNSADDGSIEEILSKSGLQSMNLSVEIPVEDYDEDYKDYNYLVMGAQHDFMHTSQQNSMKPAYQPTNEQNGDNNNPQIGARRDSPSRHTTVQNNQPTNEQNGDKPQAHVPENDGRPQTSRSWFPESWLFEDIDLPHSGHYEVTRRLPDSIANWSLLAVGISSQKGVCVSEPFSLLVYQPFFVEVIVPRRVKRLELVSIKIIVYNYEPHNLTVSMTVNGSQTLCFTKTDAGEDQTSFSLYVPKGESVGKTLQAIPLSVGDLKVNVYAQTHHNLDAVEKTIHVLAEGQKIKKTVTFILDPEAKQSSAYGPNSRSARRVTYDSATINNSYDKEKKEQKTTIDLALPVEVIGGTEFCRISAFGDIMGDIINHSIIESRNLIDSSSLDAEAVLGDLAPTVYALHYANKMELMNDKLRDKARRFIEKGITRLLYYTTKDNNSFAVNLKSKPATWLTAFVLKTLCHSSSLAYVDHNKVVYPGFNWLSKQIFPNGTLQERDWRLAKNSLDYSIMLSAEVLIAVLECNKSGKEANLRLVDAIPLFLEEHLDEIKEPLVLAKVAYALMLYGEQSEKFLVAFNRLQQAKRCNSQGHSYWSSMNETDEAKKTPAWYHKGANASSIEATAYALLIYLHTFEASMDTDAIADWLISQRNQNGAFIGAVDSTVAIQALAEYSLRKHGVKVDLHCNVSSDRQKDLIHSFKFTKENATHPESLSNVPVGQVIDVLTKGQGLGQMQVNMEYNVPINKNKDCHFAIQTTVTRTNDARSLLSKPQTSNHPLCQSCNIGCKPEAKFTMSKKAQKEFCLKKVRRGVILQPGMPCHRILQPEKIASGKKPKPTKTTDKLRQTRSVSSLKSICIHVCLQFKKKMSSGPIEAQVEMLSGFSPVQEDIDRIKRLPTVKHVSFDDNTDILRVQFTEISCKKKTCLTFRAVALEQVDRQMPAIITIIPQGMREPQCVEEYTPPEDTRLQHYCANNANRSKGECTCLTGLCSRLNPRAPSQHDLNQLVCQAKVVYQIKLIKEESIGGWNETEARIISVRKTGNVNFTENSMIQLSTPSFCMSPVSFFKNNNLSEIYLLAGDSEQLVDNRGNKTYRFPLDDRATFLQVSRNSTRLNSNTVPYARLENALRNTC